MAEVVKNRLTVDGAFKHFQEGNGAAIRIDQTSFMTSGPCVLF